jgi:di/tricarboxylate transporter
VLLVEGDPAELDKLAALIGGRLMAAEDDEERKDILERGDFIEAVVRAEALVVGAEVGSLAIPRRFDVHLLAVARQGRPHRGRLRNFRLAAGDVLLLQGDADRLAEAVARLGLLPLAARPLQLGQRGRSALGMALFAVPVVAAATGLVDLPVALTLSALAMVLTRLVPLRDLYESIDWPVIVLLGAMMPIGEAFQTTGATTLVADLVTALGTDLPAWVILAALIAVTMLLSDLLNNAATAVMMGPVALAMAKALEANPDTLLMAVAIGASCSFMTPVGHQNYTLVMGPGGYAFRDYWRVGLPLELVVVAVATPLLLYVWPIQPGS